MPQYIRSRSNTPTITTTNFNDKTGKRKRLKEICDDYGPPSDMPLNWWSLYREMDMHFHKLTAGRLHTAHGKQRVVPPSPRNRSPTRSSTFPRIIDGLPLVDSVARGRPTLQQRQRSRSAGRWPSFSDIIRLHSGDGTRNDDVCRHADNGRRWRSEAGTPPDGPDGYIQTHPCPSQGSVDPPAPPPSIVDESLPAASSSDGRHFVVIPCGSPEDEFENDDGDFNTAATNDDMQPRMQRIGQLRKTDSGESPTTDTVVLAQYDVAELRKRHVPHVSAKIPSGKATYYQQRAAFNPYRPIRVRHKEPSTPSPSMRFVHARSPTPWSPISTMLLEHSIASGRSDRRDIVPRVTFGTTTTHLCSAQR